MTTENENLPILAEDYYLRNLELLLASVSSIYSDLLVPEEEHFLCYWQKLPKSARLLFTRLVSRKGCYFRASKIAYSEIGDIPTAAKSLLKYAFLKDDPPMEPFEMLALFTKKEIQKAIHSTGMTQRNQCEGSRDQLVQIATDNPGALQNLKSGNTIYSVQHKHLLDHFLLLFFGNFSQDLSSFVLSQLGIHRYESYAYSEHTRFFNSRVEIEVMLELKQAHATLEWGREHGLNSEIKDLFEIIESGTMEQSLNPTIHRRQGRLQNQLGLFFERTKDYEKALQCYQQTQIPPARERQVRILRRLNRLSEAKQIHQEISGNPLCPEEWYFTMNASERKTWRKTIPSEKVALVYHDRVEDAVCRFLDVAHCFFSENCLWKSLLGLAFWDIIYSPVEGAFVHAYQLGPLDLFEPSFFTKRSSEIEKRLSFIADHTHWHEIALGTAREKQGIANALVNWEYLDSVPFQTVLEQIPGSVFSLIFRRMLQDLRINRSGFPDLLWLHSCKEGQTFELIEVKGPGDQLRPNQLAWLKFFQDNDIPARIIHVTKSDAPKVAQASCLRIALKEKRLWD